MTGAVGEELLRAYLDALRERGAEPVAVEALSDDRQSVVFIAGLGYLLIAISLDFPGCWQLDRERVDAVNHKGRSVLRVFPLMFYPGTPLYHRARAEGQNVFYALMIERRDGRGANGYILSDFTSSPFKRPLETEGDQLIIQEKRHLDSLRLILSTEKQVELLLRKRFSG